MNRGQMAIAALIIGGVIALTAGVVGLVVLDDITDPTVNSVAVVNESLGTVITPGADAVKTLANDCLVAAPTSVYDWTNATEIPANNYTLSTGSFPNKIGSTTLNFTVAGTQHNNTIVGVNYSYSCDYGSSTTLRTIYENVPVMVAIGLIAIAGVAFILK